MANLKPKATCSIGRLFLFSLLAVSGACGAGAKGFTPVNPCGELEKPYATCSTPPVVLESRTSHSDSVKGLPYGAVRYPDRHGWSTFLKVVAPVDHQAGSVAFLNAPWKQRRSVLSFENYWLRGVPDKFAPQESIQQRLALAGAKDQSVEKEITQCGQQARDVVFFNDTLAGYIRKHDLWYRAGIRRFFNSGKPLAFPQGSIRLKTSWVKTDNTRDIGNFITTRDSKYQLWKMVSLHVATRQIPGWTWATFEHRNNPCFDKSPGARDNFGYPYGPEGEYSKELLNMAHVVAGKDDRFLRLLEVINNYRLVGTMTDYTDNTGRPVILASSVTEAGTLQSSSCKTCHSRAALDISATKPLEMMSASGEGFIGSPQWQWFFSESEFGKFKQGFVPMDFIWSLSLCAAATDTSVSQC